jgi:hypothetical protein
MDLGKEMVKEGVTLTSNPRRNAKPGGIATMVRKPLIRFDRQVLIQELKEEKTLTQNTHSVIFIKILHILFIIFAPFI